MPLEPCLGTLLQTKIHSNMAFILFSLVLAVLAVVQPSAVSGLKSERDLRRDLFSDYNKFARPVKEQSTAVPVKISLTPLALRSLNVKDQLISLEAWMMMNWTDEYLRWDPNEYDNIKVIHVHPTELWKPDIALYTASPDTSLYPSVYTQALVYNSGTVLWVPPYTINSRCPIPFRNYVNAARPFVECNIRFGSWTYSGNMMDLQLATDKVDLTNFKDYHYEWKLVKMVSNRESKYYPCCPDDYPLVNFNVTFKRRNYYTNAEADS